jgi:hypothetical protein
MSTAEWVTAAVVAFFALLALLVFLRLLFRKGPPDWVEYRIGIYVERKPEKESLPPTTYQPSSEQPTMAFPPKDTQP